ncbi:MAG: FAD binding domain-containing protein [Pseudomonadota bacterium]
MYEFDFVKPASLAEASAALETEDALPLGGGQTLIPAMKQRLAAPTVLVSLNAISELRGICVSEDGALCIGGGTTHAQVAAEAGAHYPALAELAARIGDPAVRNRGTLGGSLANNDPAACYPAAALASMARIRTNGREIAADDFFLGMFLTALEERELIVEVRFEPPNSANYQKFLQPASRFALVGVFVARYNDHVRVSVTGASESGVFRWREAEATLSTDFVPDALTGLDLSAEGMISDMHGPAEYRAHLVKVLTGRAVAQAA